MVLAKVRLFSRKCLTKGYTPNQLVSDLIPKKSEKFEIRKNYITIFLSVKNWPQKQNFQSFRPRNLRNFENSVFWVSFWRLYGCKIFWNFEFFGFLGIKSEINHYHQNFRKFQNLSDQIHSFSMKSPKSKKTVIAHFI